MNPKPIVRGLMVGGFGVALLAGCGGGSPYGLDDTATSGMASGKVRFLAGDTHMPFLQTEVRVDPGASGGLSESAAASEDQPGRANSRKDVDVRPLTPEEQKQLGVSGGRLVNDEAEPAAEADIQSRDVIPGADGAPVKSVAQLQMLIKAHDQIARYWSAAKTQPCSC